MTDLSYLEDLEKRAIILQEMFEENSDAYKQYMSLINDFKTTYENFSERVKKLEDTVYTIVRIMKHRANRDHNLMDSLENVINSDSNLRNGSYPEERIFPSCY